MEAAFPAPSEFSWLQRPLHTPYLKLAGNRLSQVKTSSDPTETTAYSFDANDRLLTETITRGSITKTVAYAYDKTQQTSKVTTEPDPLIGTPVVTTQTFEYNLQGQMSKSTSTRTGGSEMGNDDNSSTTYEYDSAGNRIAATTTKVGSFGTSTTTRIEYLTDSQNPTGYSQVLTETEFAVDASGQVGAPIKQMVYTIGHDQISQTNLSDWNPATENWNQKSEVWFGTDGHGSVRVLYNAAVAVATNGTGHKQLYHFDAYGNLLNVTMVGTPMTVYLYNGEAFDRNIGKLYLRARWYDPQTGTFTSLDPFYGNSSDPQSYHNYTFVHSDPINGIDPTGKFMIGVALGAARFLLPGPGDFIIGGLQGLVEAYNINLQWDIDWAFDFNLPDHLGSRSDNSWVAAALGAGLHSAFNISIPFTNIGFNPLNWFGNGGDGNELGMSYEEFYGLNGVGVSSSAQMMAMRGGLKVGQTKKLMRSLSGSFSRYKTVKFNGSDIDIPMFKLPFGGRLVALFPKSVKPPMLQYEFRVSNYAQLPAGKTWRSLGDEGQKRMRNHDFEEVGNYLKKQGIAHRQNGGQITINGRTYTIHHHHRPGYFELIDASVHHQTGHIGMALWHTILNRYLS